MLRLTLLSTQYAKNHKMIIPNKITSKVCCNHTIVSNLGLVSNLNHSNLHHVGIESDKDIKALYGLMRHCLGRIGVDVGDG